MTNKPEVNHIMETDWECTETNFCHVQKDESPEQETQCYDHNSSKLMYIQCKYKHRK